MIPARTHTDTVSARIIEWKLRSTKVGLFTVPCCSIILFSSEGTSSTAQGGGGSFKNRKPIGKVGCCESGMAERIH